MGECFKAKKKKKRQIWRNCISYLNFYSWQIYVYWYIYVFVTQICFLILILQGFLISWDKGMHRGWSRDIPVFSIAPTGLWLFWVMGYSYTNWKHGHLKDIFIYYISCMIFDLNVGYFLDNKLVHWGKFVKINEVTSFYSKSLSKIKT